MARGMVVGEAIQSQAATEEYRENHDRIFGDRKPQRGKWVMTDHGLVDVNAYVPEPRAIDAPIISDRIHEGTSFDDGERVVDLGSRSKRRAFLRETGLSEASDYGPGWGERTQAQRNKHLDDRTHQAFDEAARKLYREGKIR